MTILIGFLPFLVFAVVSTTHGAFAGLLAGAVVSAVLTVKAFRNKNEVRILEVGTLILFLVLAIYVKLQGQDLSIFIVKFWVDIGLFVVAVASMALRQPFTMQFAHDQIDAKYWGSPKFQRKNYVMTGVWALIFLVMAGVEAIVGFGSDLSVNMGTVLVLIVLGFGIWFTKWFPTRTSS